MDNAILYGIVTTGEDQRVGLLQRQQKLIVQDIEYYLFPEQLYVLLTILVSLLSNS